jgi:hypothetical protein
MEHQVLADLVDVFNDERVFDQLRRTVYFLGELAAEGDLFVEGVEVDLELVDVSLADQFGIFVFGERLFVLCEIFWRACFLRAALRQGRRCKK